MRVCCEKSSELDILRKRQSGTLKIVLAINAVMFLVVVAAGILASFTALLSDSLDSHEDWVH